ncbi:hypothetical protein DFH28DRAFT_1125979 [Melampsora americana]|nr:hypothetical protein DFH28DRAFT_1125979 [Melampsora americana]
MSIDFFNPAWYNEFTNAQRTKLAATYQVPPLPNAKLLFCSVSVADEKLGEEAFHATSWDQITGFYSLIYVIGDKHDEDDDKEDNDRDNCDCDHKIGFGDTSGAEGEEDEDDFILEDEEPEHNFDDKLADKTALKQDFGSDASVGKLVLSS